MALALVAVAVLVGALKMVHVQHYLLDLVTWIRGAGWAGMVAFAFAYVVATVFFLPGSILTLGGGFAYGIGLGTVLVWVAANVGATLAFLLGRTIARDWIATRVAGMPRFAAVDRAVGREGLKIVLLTRLSPIFPFNVLNYAFGITRVSLRDYVLGSLVGMLPGTVMYVYLGSLITSVSELAAGRTSGGAVQQAFYFGGLVATVAVTLYVTRVARRALADATQEHEERDDEGAGDSVPLGGVARNDGAGRGDAPLAKEQIAQSGTPAAPLVLPDDAYNRTLVAHVHPRGWANPTPRGRYNLVVIGGGTAGLVSAAGAAGLGAKVALIERHLMGGDCLNVGCVPSKALIAAARAAADARGAGALGVQVGDVRVDFPAVMARMRRLRAEIAPHDGVERFKALGIDVFLGEGRFTSPGTVDVDGRHLDFARAVIATGGRATAPPIIGLEKVGYLTNETLFSLTTLPRRLAIIGAGPIGCEMAQTFRRFGSEVTLFESATHVLPREDADAAAIVERRLDAEGIRLVRCGHITRAERRAGEVILQCETGSAHELLACDAILLSAGRTPNVDGLGLDTAGVAYDRQGVTVNDYLQTTNPQIYAAGDVASRYQFTHMADALARIVLQNALFLGRKKASALHVPWCTYTSPEIAHVGLYEQEAVAAGHEVDTITIPMAEVDRAILDGDTEGFFRVHLVKGSDRILGATLVAAHAGDMISEVTAAMATGRGLGALAGVIHPYPTTAEVVKKAADAYNRSRLTPRVKTLFTKWLALRRRSFV
ncbi:MAG: FAD-containing oxidoreductase [Gemmatimonadaceae bacterium]|nr:FAD-containing oxidoreductase [Gemmatimonadaceae bacterium]